MFPNEANLCDTVQIDGTNRRRFLEWQVLTPTASTISDRPVKPSPENICCIQNLACLGIDSFTSLQDLRMDLQVRIVQFLSQYAKFPTATQHGKILGDEKMAINAKA